MATSRCQECRSLTKAIALSPWRAPLTGFSARGRSSRWPAYIPPCGKRSVASCAPTSPRSSMSCQGGGMADVVERDIRSAGTEEWHSAPSGRAGCARPSSLAARRRPSARCAAALRYRGQARGQCRRRRKCQARWFFDIDHRRLPIATGPSAFSVPRGVGNFCKSENARLICRSDGTRSPLMIHADSGGTPIGNPQTL